MPRTFPFYQQHDAMDCGATCLRMIARHYGRFYSLEYLRELTYLDREGVSLLGISDAAEHIGFHTLAVKTSYDRLADDIPLPCVAHWNQNHFVVVYRATRKMVWIADPAHGKIALSREEFLERWATDEEDGEPIGILLLLETTPEFYEREGHKTNKGSLNYLLSYFGKHRKLITQLVLGLIITSLIQLIFPFLMQSIVDDGINDQNLGLIYMVLLAQAVLFLSQISVEFVRGWMLLHIGVRTNINLMSDFLIKLMRLPVRFFDSKLTSDLLQRVYDHERVERLLTSTTLVTVFSTLNFIVFGLVLWYYDMTIFTIFSAATLLYIAWVVFFLRWRRDLDYKRFQQAAENQHALLELVDGMREIKLHNAEKQKRWAWERIQAKLFRISMDYLRIDQLQRLGASFINEAKNIVITIAAAKAVIEGTMTLGQLLAVQYIVGQLNAPLNQLIQFIRSTQEAKISLERMNEIHIQEDEENIEDKITILPEYGDLALENVTFHYSGPNSPMILKNVNLHIPKGKITAIVGSSGSGKTTILKLLLNFYKPSDGIVRLGDISLANVQNRLWRNQVGVVMQDEYVFSDSIARNIALGEEIIDKRRLLKAVKVANIQSFIESLPLGYNTKIGQDGVGLSQGQKQRLLIARAVYKNPDYIFFDEATNALDAYQEMLIMENLEEFFAGKTVVVVAHRLSTVMNADNIIVLEKGEIVEEGTHDELIHRRGAYYYLIRNQLELGA